MPDSLERRRILVVDDEERMVRFIRMNLEHDGFQVNEAFNGKQAIQKIRDFTPDIILLDVMMPDLDGFEVLEDHPRVQQCAGHHADRQRRGG
jgi:DNA-binding response OmpR family regulator